MKKLNKDQKIIRSTMHQLKTNSEMVGLLLDRLEQMYRLCNVYQTFIFEVLPAALKKCARGKGGR